MAQQALRPYKKLANCWLVLQTILVIGRAQLLAQAQRQGRLVRSEWIPYMLELPNILKPYGVCYKGIPM
jgi:hypothetical protein